jgi:hypothetical protein
MARRERRTFRLSCNAPVLVEGTFSGQAANVSMEGAAIVLPEAIQPGSSVAVVFLPPERDPADEAFRVQGEVFRVQKEATVVWVQETGEPDVSFRHGLRFAEPDIDLLLRAWPGKRLPE